MDAFSEKLYVYCDVESVDSEFESVNNERVIVTEDRLVVGKNGGDTVSSLAIDEIEAIQQGREKESTNDGVWGAIIGGMMLFIGMMGMAAGNGAGKISLLISAVGLIVFGFSLFLLIVGGQAGQCSVRFVTSEAVANVTVKDENIEDVVAAVEEKR